jgi:hypothetical protein
MIFKRDQLTRPDGTFVNACGKSHGASIDRCTGLSDAQIRARAKEYADEEPGRHSLGAAVAGAQALRDIRLKGLEDKQAIYVYDDANEPNPRHGILRCSDEIPRSRFSELRKELLDRFSYRIAA